MRLGLAITTYSRPDSAVRLAQSSRRWTSTPARTVIANNSAVALASSSEHGFEVIGGDGNVGLPEALGRCFRHLADCDAVLVLDDDSELAADTAEALLAHLTDGVGVVSVPRHYTTSMKQRGRQLFPWSPSLISRKVIELVGYPRSELFFGLDDWDYGIRVTRAGQSIVWLELQMPRQSLAESWDGRTYLTARNSTYLALWANRDPIFWRIAWAQLRTAVGRGRGAALRRRGIRDGATRRMGPPPSELQPPRPVSPND